LNDGEKHPFVGVKFKKCGAIVCVCGFHIYGIPVNKQRSIKLSDLLAQAH